MYSYTVIVTMIKLNIQNVEELVFSDKDLRKKIPDYNHLFASWDLSKMSLSLRNLGKKAVLDFLSSLQPEHVEIISQHINFSVELEILDYRLVKNITTTLINVEGELDQVGNYNLTPYREGEQVYITAWK